MSAITNEFMLELTASMPMKQIDVGGKPYLQRYYAGTLGDGSDLWLHRFLSADGEEHLHSHPWEGLSIVLAGGYEEEIKNNATQILKTRRREPPFRLRPVFTDLMGEAKDVIFLSDLAGYGEMITPFTWHRIVHVEPDTWTLMVVRSERLPLWFFDEGDGDIEPRASSPRDWWESCGIRGEDGAS